MTSFGRTLVAAGVAIVVGPFLWAFLLSLGPLGWLGVGGAFIAVGLLVSLFEGTDGSDGEVGGDADGGEGDVCGSCGRPNPRGVSRCQYCSESFSTAPVRL